MMKYIYHKIDKLDDAEFAFHIMCIIGLETKIIILRLQFSFPEYSRITMLCKDFIVITECKIQLGIAKSPLTASYNWEI